MAVPSVSVTRRSLSVASDDLASGMPFTSSDGGPSPTLVRKAITSNVYSMPGWRFGIVEAVEPPLVTISRSPPPSKASSPHFHCTMYLSALATVSHDIISDSMAGSTSTPIT